MRLRIVVGMLLATGMLIALVPNASAMSAVQGILTCTGYMSGGGDAGQCAGAMNAGGRTCLGIGSWETHTVNGPNYGDHYSYTTYSCEGVWA